ncbi:MAG: histidine ammonia-lyase [Anaerolineae bacterium]|nr:histidine ammonia-lyase [Anaerolineae bacterium]
MTESRIIVDGETLRLDDVVAVAEAWAEPGALRVELSPTARERVARARQAVEGFLSAGEVVYGVTTGFGHFMDRLIPPEDSERLQQNILKSHAVGVGRPVDEATTRATMLIRANTLAKGHSGARVETVERLLAALNAGVHPIIPEKGSLGASGDLAPLAHMALVLVGQGEARYRGEVLPGGEALRRAGLEPLLLGAKEGLALTNGTAFMTAIGVLVTARAERVAQVADVAGALSCEALHGTPRAFDPRIHAVRPHPRQVACAAYLRRLLEGSEFLRPDDPLNVHDAYTLRCIPQVHGAARDAIAYARWVLEIELNSATDNPLIFFEEDGTPTCLSGGNFHGEPVAIAMDYLSIALAEIGNISERRLTRLTDDASNQGTLPAFLIKHGGLNSGFMLAQYTAAALASENKVLAHPASVDTVPTSANTEDHVSMGPIAARQAAEILDNVEAILAIELLAAAQGIDFRREVLGDVRLGRGTAPAYALIRRHVPFLEEDAYMAPLIEAVRRLVHDGELVRAVNAELER